MHQVLIVTVFIIHDLPKLQMNEIDEFNPRVFPQSFQNIFTAY